MENLNCISGCRKRDFFFLLLVIAKPRWWHHTQDASANSSPFDFYLTYFQRSSCIQVGVKFPVQRNGDICSTVQLRSVGYPHGFLRRSGFKKCVKKYSASLFYFPPLFPDSAGSLPNDSSNAHLECFFFFFWISVLG